MENTSVSQEIISTDFETFLLCIIHVCEESKILPAYNFNGAFSGWYMIVYPFLAFLEGLAVVPGRFVYGKIVHLSQSSGFGKTRLCIKILRAKK